MEKRVVNFNYVAWTSRLYTLISFFSKISALLLLIKIGYYWDKNK